MIIVHVEFTHSETLRTYYVPSTISSRWNLAIKQAKKKKKPLLSSSLYFNGVTQTIINYQVVIDGENKAKGCAPDGTDLYFSCVVN